MTRKIDTDAVINSVRLKEQGSAPSTPAAGYANLYQAASGLYFVDDNGVVAGPLGANFVPTGRLTLTTATPVTTADVTGAATLYYTPYNGNVISLYDGERWIPVVYVEKSLTMVGATASKPYDIWGYLSAGTLALEKLVWTDATTRATALAYQNGRLVKSGDATRLYLGTVYCNSSGGQTDDSLTKRNVYNYYNRVARRLYKEESTGHAYNSATQRYWNNDTTQFVEFVQGVLAENPITFGFRANLTGSATGPTGAITAAALDWSSGAAANSDPVILTFDPESQISGSVMLIQPTAVGRHYIAIIENATAANNVTFTNFRASGVVWG